MELGGGELTFPAKPGFPRHSQVSEGDPCDHTSLSEHVNAIMSHASFHSVGCVLHEACGGAPCTSESGSPCGSPSRPIVSESDACRPSPPCQSSSTLRRGGLGTNGNILHVASGGYHSDASSDDPCGLKGLRPDWVRDACRRGPHGEPPSPCLELPCSNSYIMHVASGGSSLPPFHEFDGCLQTLPQPLSPPLPSIAAIHDHGLHLRPGLRQEDLKEPSTPGCIQLSDDAVAQVSLAAGGHLGPRNCVPHAPGDEGAGATRSAGQNAGAPQHHRTQRANAGGQVPVGMGLLVILSVVFSCYQKSGGPGAAVRCGGAVR